MRRPTNRKAHHRFFTAVTALCFALSSNAALSQGEPGAGSAENDEVAAEQAPKAAVVPTVGKLDSDSLKSVTIELRYRLRDHGFLVEQQAKVRQVSEQVAPNQAPTAGQLAAIGQLIGADVVVFPSVVEVPGVGHRLQLVGFDGRRGAHRGYAAALPALSGSGYTREQVSQATEAVVVALLDLPPGPAPAIPLDLTGLQPKEPDSGDAPGDERPMPKPLEDAPEEESGWERWDHEGVFMDLGFVLSRAYGDELTRDAATGFGARLRLGYRIFSMLAVSISPAGAFHEIPRSADLADLADTERTFAWTGIYGGLRFHPVRRFILDPFVGLDVGWTWMFHMTTQELVIEVPGGEDLPDGLYPDEVEEFKNLANPRTTITMQGFTLVPQAGLRIFLTPHFALGVVVELNLPMWSKVCVQVTDPTKGSDKLCGKVDEAKVLVEKDFTEFDLSKKKELPRFLNTELNLTFVF